MQAPSFTKSIKKPSLHAPSFAALKNKLHRGKKDAEVDEQAPAAVDPVIEARDADEGALDTPHQEVKPVASKESNREAAEEEEREAEPVEESREEAPAAEEESQSVEKEPSKEEAEAPEAEPVAEEAQPVDEALSTVKEEEEEASTKEEPKKEAEPVAAEPSVKEMKAVVEEKTSAEPLAVDATPSMEEDATVETRDSVDNKGCLSPVNTSFCGIDIRTLFE
jgi:hypothetical protein